jgi:RimJ/RimL family protein N-acetyltransferase
MHTVFFGGRQAEPLRRLAASARGQVEAHFLALEPAGRCLRFNAAVSDDTLRRHVAALDFERDLILGAEGDEGQLAIVVHLAKISDEKVEFSISVLEPWRGQGHGQEMTHVGLTEAARHGFQLAYVQFMSYNQRMGAIMSHYDSQRERAGTEHCVQVPLPANLVRPFQPPIGPFVPSMVGFN